MHIVNKHRAVFMNTQIMIFSVMTCDSKCFWFNTTQQRKDQDLFPISITIYAYIFVCMLCFKALLGVFTQG